MPGSGTRTFLEPDHYEASLRRAQIEIVIALSPKFKARLTWAELHDLQVLACEEDFPRVAYVCLAPQLSFVTFPARSGSLPVWGGTELRPGEIVRGTIEMIGAGTVVSRSQAHRDHYSRAWRSRRLTSAGHWDTSPLSPRQCSQRDDRDPGAA
jgi:hypothetical protein